MLGLGVDEIISILQVGFSGVAFLFLVMSFKLLRNEQDRKDHPRDSVLQSIRSFSKLTLLFALLVLISSIIDNALNPKQLPANCEAALNRAEQLITSDNHNAETIRTLFNSTITQCR